MGNKLERLEVVIEANPKKLKEGAAEAKRSVKEMVNSVNADVKKIKSPLENMVNDRNMKMLENTKNLIRKSMNDMKSGVLPKGVMNGVKEYVREAQLAAGIKVYSDDYLKLGDDISDTEKELSRLEEKFEKMDQSKRYVQTEEFKDLEKDISSTEKAVDRLMEKKKKMESSGKAYTTTVEFKSMSEHMADAQKRLDAMIAKKKELNEIGITNDGSSVIMNDLMEGIQETEREIKYLKGEMDDLKTSGGDKVPTDDFKELGYEIGRTEKKLEGYREKKREMILGGSNLKESESFRKTTLAIEDAKEKLAEYNAEKANMESTGTNVKLASPEKMSSGSWIQSAGAVAGQALGAIPQKMKEIRAHVVETVRSIPGIGRAATEASYLGSKAFSGMSAAMKKIGPAIKSVSGVFGALIKKFASGIPVIGKLISGQRSLHSSSNGLSGGLFKLGNMFKLMVLRMGIRAVIDGIRDGFKNLAQYSGSANVSMSTLMSSLTQLKNSFAAAFAPILSAVVPILSTLISYVIAAANAIGKLLSVLGGKGTFIQAKKVNQDYAKSLGGAASGAGSAAKETEKYKKSLMGFDQINKLDDNSNSGGGGAGGGGGGGLSPSDMFEEVEIDSSVKKIADMLKEAWANADFTEVGKLVGKKLNEALEKIDWGKIRGTSEKIAKSIATFLNGFIEGTDWGLVGYTFANGINTLIDFGYYALTTFDWGQFGRAISDFINSAVETIDLSRAMESASAFVKGILDAYIQAAENTNWNQLGKKIATAVSKIDWKGITKRIYEAIGAALGGLASFLLGLVEPAWKSVVKWWKETAYEDGKFTIQGLLKGIWDALVSIGTWIKENIFDPFVNGFKRAFGINSPSTVMAEQGGYIIDGLLKGLKDKIDSVLDWFRQLPGRVKEALGNAKTWLVSLGKDAIDGLKTGWDTAWTGFKTFLSGIPKKIKDAIGSLSSIGKSVIQTFVDGFKSLHIPTPHFKKVGTFSFLGIDTPIPQIGVSWYAKGGFPDVGEMFIAREKGPELVGRMGSKNTVANNGQIIAGIKEGVIEGLMEVFMATGGFGGGNNQPYTFYIEVKTENDEVLARAVQRGNEKLDYRFNPSPA